MFANNKMNLLAGTMLVLACHLSFAANTQTSTNTGEGSNIIAKDPMGTSELLQETLSGIGEKCLDWCIVGLSFYLVGCPYCSIETTPRIAHNIPDFAFLSHPQIGNSPWKEWSEVFGEAQISLESSILSSLTNGMFDNPGGGQSQFKQFGRHQTHTFKETQAVGNPVSLLFRLIGGNGEYLDTDAPASQDCEVDGCLENDPTIGDSINVELGMQDNSNGGTGGNQSGGGSDGSGSAAQNYLGSWGSTFVGYSDPEILEAFSYLDTIEQLGSYAESTEIFGQMSEMGDAQNASMSAQRVVCPSEAYPFLPYYLSSLDGYFWRNGFPVTDLDRAATILNPISDDKIGPLNKKGGHTIETWGHIYPRHGVVDNPNDQHVAAVTTVRAADILNDTGAIHLKWPVQTQYIGMWQPIYPERKECKPYIVDGKISDNAGYIWNLWRRYSCDMSEPGIYITTVYFPQPACIKDS